MWGALHNGDGMLGGSAADQLCLLHSNVGSAFELGQHWSSPVAEQCHVLPSRHRAVSVQSCSKHGMSTRLCVHLQVLDDVKGAARITAAAAAQPASLATSDRAVLGDAPNGAGGDARNGAQSDAAAAEGSAAAAPAAGGAEPADADADADASADREEELRSRPADVVASVNFSLCLLHTRGDAMHYLRLARAAMQQEHGSIMVGSITGLSM